MKHEQTGNVFVGIIIGIVIGLAAALAVAVYVTKVPVPFLNKGPSRSAEQDAAESRKNQNWDPNAPLYGKNPAKPLPPAPGVAVPAPPASAPVGGYGAPVRAGGARRQRQGQGAAAPAVVGRPAPATRWATGQRARRRRQRPLHLLRAGRRLPHAEDAEAQRAKLSLMGMEAKVTEREQSGRQVWRVRIGPFNSKDDADRQKEKLDAGGFDTALVRVQR